MLCKEWSWNSKVTENDSQSQESQLVKNIHLAVSKLFALLLGLGYQNIYKTPTSAPQCTLIKSLFFAISLSYPHDLFKHVFKSVFQKHLVF